MFWISNAYAEGSKFMPLQGTTIAENVDSLYAFLLIVSLLSCVLLLGGMVYFVIKYRRQTPDQKTAYISHNSFLEFLWSFIPFVIFMIVAVWGWIIYHDMRTPPEGAREIQAIAQKWQWTFAYKNGHKEAGKNANLYVPAGEPVKIVLTSKDVLHSFYIPSFRIKQDAIPGRYTSVWFEAKKPGEYIIFCTEYCGAEHSNMMGKVIALTKEEYDEWLNLQAPPIAVYEKGEHVYAKNQCASCHSMDGKRVVGPSLKGIFGKTVSLNSGEKVKIDENYLRESILRPNAKARHSFVAGVMPSYQGRLSEEELSALIAYIKEQRD
jgi:cytochrome c oxidase subunit 2